MSVQNPFDDSVIKGVGWSTETLKAIKEFVDALEPALGNLTGDMSAVTQSDAASLAAYLTRLKEHYRAHDQTRICFVIPGAALDVPNTAIKTELDKIGTVSVLTEGGVANCQEDWNVYDLVVVGTDVTTVFTAIANIDDLILLKLPIVVCCSSAAEELLMGTAAAQSTADDDEFCESVANRVMYRVFVSTGEKVLFDSGQESDMLDMSNVNLTPQVLMVDTTGGGPAETVVGWLPMETVAAITNKLSDGTDIPAGRVFAGCFYNADKLTDLGKDFLRSLCRNVTQASITPSISLKAAGALVAAIHNDTNALETRWTAALATILGNFTALRIGYLDQLDFDLQGALTAIVNYLDSEIADILADTDELQTDWVNGGRLDLLLDAITAAGPTKAEMDAAHALLATLTKQNRVLCSMDFWSALGGEAVVTGAQTTVTVGLNNVVVEDLPDGATIVRAVAMMKFRMIENLDTVNANKLDAFAALPMQVDDAANNGMRDCINFVDDAFALAASGREGGDVIIGDIDISDRVDGIDTYDFQWFNAKADHDSLQFNDVQMGIRIWYRL